MVNESPDKYIGDELTIFDKAVNWKRYYGGFLREYLKGRILEVGAGIGGTTLSLCDGSQDEWVCLEPDPNLAQNINKQIAESNLPPCCRCKVGTLKDMPLGQLFDAIIYIDVMEHIEDDKAELGLAEKYLDANGVLMIVVPAHQFLYTPFDRAIGHLRRYTRKQLMSIVPHGFNIIKAIYLDSVGLTASLANKLFLRQSYPSIKQILFWDRVIIRMSELFDPLLCYRVGKSVLLIARKL
ncbi:MAG: methyltransferase domain-containing protein [Candidatus Omnitrophica bacterium]|nr:methyltransferase domain-containing protein [Candidatus Omnitrophota bacterium]